MKKYLLFAVISIVFLIGLGTYQYFQFNDGRLHIVFCDVGQGDAIFIRTPNHKFILIDAGPDKKVLECLSKYTGFWERAIDLAILTHPHQDHFFGFNHVIGRYEVRSFATEKLDNNTGSFKDLIKNIRGEVLLNKIIFAGDKFTIGDILLSVESPSRIFLQKTSSDGLIGNNHEFASLILKITYKGFDLLLTGDSQSEALSQVISKNQNNIEVLHVPHHGSATGLDKQIIKRISPKIAVISAGAKNRYGHPSRKILKMLNEAGVKILRTDEDGDIEIVSDGRMFWVKRE